MATKNQGYIFKGNFPRDGNGSTIAVLGGIVEDSRSPGLTDTYTLAAFNSDGKLMVDTELTLDVNNLTISNMTVTNSRDITETSQTGSGAVNFTTGLTHAFRLDHVRMALSAASSNGVTVTIDDKDGATYDTVIDATTLSSDTSYVYQPDVDMCFESGNQINVKYVNNGGATYGIKIVTEQID